MRREGFIYKKTFTRVCLSAFELRKFDFKKGLIATRRLRDMYFNVYTYDSVCFLYTYRRGLSALLVLLKWACEGLKAGTSKSEIPTLFLYIILFANGKITA